MDQRGAVPRLSHVRDMVNILLSKRGKIPIQSVGISWAYNLVERQDEPKTRYIPN